MEINEIQTLFKQFLSQHDSARQAEVWGNQSQVFKRFWKEKILDPKSELTVADTDAIIRLLDTKARGHQQTDVPVAHVGIYQGVWERLFNDLKTKKDIQATMSLIFAETNDEKLIGLIDRLAKENEPNKNGLTGKNGNALNALLFINNPYMFLSCVSLSHRFPIMDAFGLGDPDELKTYGQRIILSNRKILNGFREKYRIDASPRDLSQFLYTPHSGYTTSVKVLWQSEDKGTKTIVEVETEEPSREASEMEFVMEKHLEEFLVRNWEHTELGKKYDLIEEDGDLVSPQYKTEIGVIDLLVKDKKTKQFVVIELKKGQTSDDTVGQVARYMGWVKKNLAEGNDVKGIIIAGANDLRLQYALQMIEGVELLVYRVSFALEKAATL